MNIARKTNWLENDWKSQETMKLNYTEIKKEYINL